jgi:hypothetical protein
MLCRRARNWISLAMDGELPPDRTVALTEHLERCEHCRAYRDDLQIGRRLIAATTPAVADNFEWRLQLKLSQTLQGAAKSIASPFAPPLPGLARWASMAGLATAAGVALVFAASALLGPTTSPVLLTSGERGGQPMAQAVDTRPAATPIGAGSGVVTSTAGAANRTALTGGGLPWHPRQGIGLGEQVTSFTGGTWSGTSMSDLRTITSLREENQRLRAALSVAQREVEFMKTQLDTTDRASRQDPH